MKGIKKIIITCMCCPLLMLSLACTNSKNSNSNAIIEKKVDELLSKMTLSEKIGQMTQVDRRYLKDINDIQRFFLGSLLSGGGSTPATNTPSAWADMYDEYQSIALKTRLKIPLIYGIDAVHGHNNVYSAVIFPHNIGMGCTRNPELVKQAAQITAKEVAGTGIDWTFEPCVAVPLDERWGRTYEGFGENPELVSELGLASVQGFQGCDLADAATILACSKHFVGDGGTTDGIDQGNTEVDINTLRSVHMQGYITTINAGVGSVMASFNSWNNEKVHGNKYLLTTILKEELGFRGILVSDWAAIDQLPGDYSDQVEASINAGLDMIMVPEHYEKFINTLTVLVNQKKVPITRIDDAVKRILFMKFKLGLFEQPFTNRDYTKQIGSKEHRKVARECVRQSLVLLKNENKILPLSKDLKHIHVAGRNADDLGHQCGGWSITWQGGSGDITLGTSILEAIRSTVSTSTEVTYSLDGKNVADAEVGIVVVGESPYAEGNGDKTDLSLIQEDIAAVKNMKKAGIPVIVILISGRPMIINSVLDYCDAFIAAWLPGTEGHGVSDVIFGDYNPTGKLSYSWPRDMSQLPINIGDANYDPLFEYGFGLSF